MYKCFESTNERSCHSTKIKHTCIMAFPSGYVAVLLLHVLTRPIVCSIAGVTYRDDFDFEERYRDVHECDPFYWHPLHLPDHCADIYEKLIRSKIASTSRLPVRIVQQIRSLYDEEYYDDRDDRETSYHRKRQKSPYIQYLENPYEYPRMQVADEPAISRELTPYEAMLASVREDVKYLPSYPTIQVMPNYGPVAMYRQPISSKSAKMIKKLAKTYSDAAQEAPVYENPSEDDVKKQSNWKGLVDKAIKKGWKKKEKGRVVTLTKIKP